MAKQTACYVRVSTTDQKKGLASQKKALKDYADNHGLSNVVWYEDKVSGGSLDRPAFAKLQKAVFNGEIETILVWKLDRVSRSLKDGIVTLTDWVERGVRVISVTQLIDMHGPTGRLIATVLFAVSEMEREGIRENTRRGLMAAKARGVKLGRPETHYTEQIDGLKAEGLNMGEIAKKMGLTRQALYFALAREKRQKTA